MIPFHRRFFPLGVAAFASGCLAEGWVPMRTVCTIPVTQESARMWASSDPSAVSVTYLPNGGEKGGGALAFRILKPLDKPLVVQGPAVEVPACPASVVRRNILLKMEVRYLGFVDGSMGVCLASAKTGQRLGSLAGNRDFQTAYYLGRARNGNWVMVFDEAKYGIKLGGDTQRVSLRPTLDFRALDGKGECRIQSFELVEQDVITHRIGSDSPGNTFFGDVGEVFIRWAEVDKMASASVTVRNEEGRTLWTTAVTGGTAQTECTLPCRGYYAIEAAATYVDGRTLTTRSTAAVIGAALTEKVRLASRFGLMLCHMSSDFAKKIGVNITSGFFNLDGIRPKPDGTLFSTLAGTAPAGQKDFIYFAGQTGGNPYWLRNPATKNGEVYPPTDWKKFEAAVELWAATNPNMPDCVSAYHEVNASWRGSEADLVRYYRVFAEAVKRARPGQKISVPTFCNNDWPYLMRLVKKGIMYQADAVNMHPYVNGTAPEKEFITGIIELQAAMKENGIGNLPIYFTEFGWSCDGRDWQAPVDSLTRARYCARSLILCTARDIAGLVYFAGRYVSEDPQEHYWLVRNDYTPWPALAAYCGVTHELSTVKGGGIYLPLSPNLFACLFQRGEQSLLTLWTMSGTERIALPETPADVHSMTQVPLVPARIVSLSPSPQYLAFGNLRFARTRDAGEHVTELLPGDSFPLDGTPVLVPSEFQVSADGRTASFRENAPSGAYGIILEKGGEYNSLHFRLLSPVTADYREYVWDGASPSLRIRFSAESVLKGVAAGFLSIQTGSQTNTPVPFQLNEREPRILEAEMPAVSGKRLIGKGVFHLTSPIQRTLEVPLDITATAVCYHSDDEVLPDWNHMPTINFTHWQREGQDVRARDFGQTPSFVQMYANRKAFYFRVRVVDCEHVQTPGSWPGMWAMDSIQYLFDADTGRPWEVNNINKGYNGHRISQYGASLTETGESQYWCYQAYFDEGNLGPYGEMPKIARDEATRETVYELAIPWKRMGLKSAPPAGSPLGFSLLVNDKGKNAGRKIVQFGKAIPNPNPESILQLLLIEPSR